MAEESTNTEGTQEPTSEKTVTTTAEKQEKLVPQSEVDKLIDKRYAEWKSKAPADDELKAFKEWKKAQQTEADKQKERDAEYAKLQTDTETLRKENIAYKLGVNAEDVDYVVYKVGKMDGKFEENLKSYLEENTKFTEPKTTTVGGIKHNPLTTGNEDGVETAFLKRNPGLKVD